MQIAYAGLYLVKQAGRGVITIHREILHDPVLGQTIKFRYMSVKLPIQATYDIFRNECKSMSMQYFLCYSRIGEPCDLHIEIGKGITMDIETINRYSN